MDALTPSLPGARVLDLFAGAGGVGLEALSRGAAHATFVERDARAVAALRRNIGVLGLAEACRVLALDVFRALERLQRTGERFELAFLDPPYEAGLVDRVLDHLGAGTLLAPGVTVVAQHFTKAPPAGAYRRLRMIRRRRFGETTLSFYEGS